MRLTKAKFSGFGRLASTQINLDHKVVAIVGPNEAGKTTLLRALAYIDNGDSLTVAERSRATLGDVPDDQEVVRVQYRLDERDQAAVTAFDLQDKPTELWLSRTAGPGEVRTEVVPTPRKSPATLRKRLGELLAAATDAALSAEALGEDDEIDPDEDRTTFRSRLIQALLELRNGDDQDPEGAATILVPSDWIRQFDEYGITGPIRDALAEIQSWLTQEDPGVAVAHELFSRTPNIVLFTEDDRMLRSSYELSEQLVVAPPASLRNLAAMASLPLAELWKTINNGDEGARETLVEQANQELQARFSQVWNQSNISAHLKISGVNLEIRVKQDGRTITQFNERSAGVQMFVTLVAFLAVRDHRAAPVLLIDEAETHLHVDAQADLVNEFMAQDRAAKIIYTTHSPACLPPDLGTNIRAVVPDPENGQRSVIEGSFWRNSAGFSPLLLAMGASAAAFSAARRAVIAEGATEMLLLPSLIKRAVGLADLDYQVTGGLSETPASMYSELDLEAARVAFLVDGDPGGASLRASLIRTGVPERRVVTLGALTLENLLDPESYRLAIARLINDVSPSPEVSPADLPDLSADPASNWPNVIQVWARENNYRLPGKRVIASRLIEDGLALPSETGITVLKELHEALTNALDAAATTSRSDSPLRSKGP